MVKNKKYISCMRTKIVLVSVGVFLIGFAVVFFFAVQRQYHSGLENGKGVGQGIENPIGKVGDIPPLPQGNAPTQGVENGSEERIVGGDRDEHGCIGSAGYTWCETKRKCLRLWEEICEGSVAKPDYEEHGCSGFAGEVWCASQQKCLRAPECDALQGGQLDTSCRVQNCHGLDIVCGFGGEAMCTMMYQLGDKCRQYASCEKVDGTCRQKANPKFDTCKACVQNCEKKYPDDPSQAFTCEASCK